MLEPARRRDGDVTSRELPEFWIPLVLCHTPQTIPHPHATTSQYIQWYWNSVSAGVWTNLSLSEMCYHWDTANDLSPPPSSNIHRTLPESCHTLMQSVYSLQPHLHERHRSTHTAPPPTHTYTPPEYTVHTPSHPHTERERCSTVSLYSLTAAPAGRRSADGVPLSAPVSRQQQGGIPGERRQRPRGSQRRIFDDTAYLRQMRSLSGRDGWGTCHWRQRRQTSHWQETAIAWSSPRKLARDPGDRDCLPIPTRHIFVGISDSTTNCDHRYWRKSMWPPPRPPDQWRVKMLTSPRIKIWSMPLKVGFYSNSETSFERKILFI